jgi:hypothetical protein
MRTPVERYRLAADAKAVDGRDLGVAQAVLDREAQAAGDVLQAAEGVELLQEKAGDEHAGRGDGVDG